MTRLVLSLVAALFSINAASALETSADLSKLCNPSGKPKEVADLGVTVCDAYVQGLLDAHALINGLFPEARVVCPPEEGIPNDEVRTIFLKWLAKHPELTRLPPRATVLKATATMSSAPLKNENAHDSLSGITIATFFFRKVKHGLPHLSSSVRSQSSAIWRSLSVSFCHFFA